MTTNFKSKLVNELGSTPVEVLSSSPTAVTTVIGLSLTNLTDSIILSSVSLTNLAGTTAYFIRNVIIPPNQSLRVINGGERLVLEASTSLSVEASADNSLDVVLSYVEIS